MTAKLGVPSSTDGFALDIRPLGDRAIRFARPAGPTAAMLVDAVRAWPGVVDVVVTAHHVAAYFEREPAELDVLDVGALLARSLADVAATERSPPRTVELRVHYDGLDLADVARTLRATVDEVRALHSSATYVVETMGFAPGFAYMSGLPAELHLPRRATPRPHVSGGSVAIAGAYSTVYPFDSPGGWHVLGRIVDATMFDDRGALLQLGDRVRFVPA